MLTDPTPRGRPFVGYHIARAAAQEVLNTADENLLKEIPPPPSDFDEFLTAYWDYYCNLKLAEQDLRQQWLPMIAVLCRHHQMELILEQDASRGSVIYSADGSRAIKNPAVTELRQIRNDITRCYSHLRMTPQSVVTKQGAKASVVIRPPRDRASDRMIRN